MTVVDPLHESSEASRVCESPGEILSGLVCLLIVGHREEPAGSDGPDPKLQEEMNLMLMEYNLLVLSTV